MKSLRGLPSDFLKHRGIEHLARARDTNFGEGFDVRGDALFGHRKVAFRGFHQRLLCDVEEDLIFVTTTVSLEIV